MNDPIKVLDHGLVRLVEHMGSDLSIVRNARVSYDAEWRTGEDDGKDAKLLDYLIKNKHTSPFESVNFTFEIKAPIFVLRQWHRHRTWCLAGDTEIEFRRPVDGKPYKVRIDKLAATWNPKVAKRRRKDQSPLDLQEHNRKRVSDMSLVCRGVDGNISTTKIIDVWKSGEKEIFEIKAGNRKIRASADHKFFSEGSWVAVRDLGGRSVTLLSKAGGTVVQNTPQLTVEDITTEKWAEFSEGYEVSTLGRVRSSWGQGKRHCGNPWMYKKIVISGLGRAMVSWGGKAEQVSRIAARTFLGAGEDGHVVRHLDDNALNNRIENLAWGTQADNHNDSKRNGTRARQAWVEEKVTSITSVGFEPVYDMTVEDNEHNFVANNFLVHNCYNEISARYAELPEEYYVPELAQITTQSADNKQMRTDDVNEEADRIRQLIDMSNTGSFEVYKTMLEAGCPRELARSVLPVGTYSHMFATVDLHNLMHFLKLRLHSHSQYEIRVYAEAMLKLIEPIVPHSVAAFKEHILGA
jgi:thymidylate synthase ThyX